MCKSKPNSHPFRAARLLRLALVLLLLLPVLSVCAFAEETGGAVEVINNFTSYISTIIRGIGALACLFAGVQFAASLQSHDASQRTNSILVLVGGLLLFFMPEILTSIGVSI